MMHSNNLYPEEWDELTLAQQKRRNNYWSLIRLARKDFYEHMVMSTEYALHQEAFVEYVRETYGIEMLTIEGNISADYNIVDKNKYLLFLMKFGGQSVQ